MMMTFERERPLLYKTDGQRGGQNEAGSLVNFNKKTREQGQEESSKEKKSEKKRQ